MNYVGKMIICVIIMAGLTAGMFIVNTIDFDEISYAKASENVFASQSLAPAEEENTEPPENTVDNLYTEVPVEVPYDPYIPEAKREISDINTTPVKFEKNEDAITIAAMGDIFVPPSQVEAAKVQNGYDFNSIFKYIKPYIEKADMAIANLNSPVAGELAGYSEGTDESYISNAPTEMLNALKTAGFDVIVTANGRTLDKEKAGVERTIKDIRDNQLKESGTHIIDDEKSILIETVKDTKVAVCSYTAAMDINYEGIDTGYNVVQLRDAVNFINKEKVVEDIKELKIMGAEVIILNLCYNEKGENIPSQKQLELAELFIGEGASVVIGSGTNNLQGIDVYTANANKGIVFHSLGSSVSGVQSTDNSMITFIDIIKKDGKVQLSNIRYIPTTSYGINKNIEILPCNPNSYEFFDENMTQAAKQAYNNAVELIGSDAALPAE